MNSTRSIVSAFRTALRSSPFLPTQAERAAHAQRLFSRTLNASSSFKRRHHLHSDARSRVPAVIAEAYEDTPPPPLSSYTNPALSFPASTAKEQKPQNFPPASPPPTPNLPTQVASIPASIPLSLFFRTGAVSSLNSTLPMKPEEPSMPLTATPFSYTLISFNSEPAF